MKRDTTFQRIELITTLPVSCCGFSSVLQRHLLRRTRKNYRHTHSGRKTKTKREEEEKKTVEQRAQQQNKSRRLGGNINCVEIILLVLIIVAVKFCKRTSGQGALR